jgi:hypothetical protein
MKNWRYAAHAQQPSGLPALPFSSSGAEARFVISLLSGLCLHCRSALCQRLRRDLRWDEGYDNVRVPRAKGQEDNYYAGTDPRKAAAVSSSGSATPAASKA